MLEFPANTCPVPISATQMHSFCYFARSIQLFETLVNENRLSLGWFRTCLGSSKLLHFCLGFSLHNTNYKYSTLPIKWDFPDAIVAGSLKYITCIFSVTGL